MANQPPATLLLIGNEGGGQFSSARILVKNSDPKDRPQVVVLTDGRMARTLEDLGATVHRLGYKPPLIINQPSRWGLLRAIVCRLWNTAWIVQRAWRVAWFLRRRCTPLVHTNPGYGALVATLAKPLGRFAFICHWRGVGVNLLRMRRFVGLLTRSVDQFIAISQAVKRSLPPRWQEKTQVVYNAIEIDEVSQRAEREAGRLRELVSVDSTVPLILSVGTYAQLKGQHLLVQAMRQVAHARPDALCVFVGSTPTTISRQYFERVRKQAEALAVGHRCRFLLDVPTPDTLFQDAAVAAMTTTGIGEGFGLVIVEAMACQTPVVAFDAGAAREVLEDQRTGLLVPDENCDAFASAILELLNDPERARAMGRAGLLRARRLFNAPRVAAEVAEVYSRFRRMPPRRAETVSAPHASDGQAP